MFGSALMAWSYSVRASSRVAVIAQHVGQIGQGGGIVGLGGQRGAVMRLGRGVIAFFAPGRAQGQLQFRAFGLARQGRLQQGDGGIELALRAQQIGQIDQGLQRSGSSASTWRKNCSAGAARPRAWAVLPRANSTLASSGCAASAASKLGDGLEMPAFGRQSQAWLDRRSCRQHCAGCR